MIKWFCFLTLMSVALPALAVSPDLAVDISTSGSLVEEVLSHSPDPHERDWRETPLQIEIGYSSLQEQNSFKSSSVSVGVARSFAPAWLGRLELRRVTTVSTSSSDSLSLTPYSQAGQPSRYEGLIGVGYALLDGRVATPLSPRSTDIGNMLYALLGLQYNYFTSQDPEPLPGMQAVYSTLAAEAGLRYQIFLPQSLGVALEWTLTTPLTSAHPDLPYWQRLGGSVSWSFGN